MKKNISLLLLLCTTIIIITLSFSSKQEERIIVDRNAIGNIFINYRPLESQSDREILLDILMKYRSKKTSTSYFPYESSKIRLTINYTEGSKPREILLGDFNIWYESGDQRVYEIINGDRLLTELNNLINKKY